MNIERLYPFPEGNFSMMGEMIDYVKIPYCMMGTGMGKVKDCIGM
jgi:hypothetical protein